MVVKHSIKSNQRVYDQLHAENMARDKALANLSTMVKEYGSSPVTMRPHPVIQADVLDELAGVVSALMGSHRRPWMEQGPEGATVSVLSGGNCHERGSGAGGQ